MNRQLENMSIRPAATLPREIIINDSRDAAEVEQPGTVTVAQTAAAVGKDSQRSGKEAVPSLSQETVTCDGIDEELSANLTDLMHLGQKAQRNSVAETSTRGSILRNLTSTTGIGRVSSTTSLQDLRSTIRRSLNASDQEGISTSRRSSLVQQGRRPSLRRRHSICYYSAPSSAGEEESSSRSTSNLACDRRESFSSIITEVHSFAVGVDWLSDSDDSESDDDGRERSD